MNPRDGGKKPESLKTYPGIISPKGCRYNSMVDQLPNTPKPLGLMSITAEETKQNKTKPLPKCNFTDVLLKCCRKRCHI